MKILGRLIVWTLFLTAIGGGIWFAARPQPILVDTARLERRKLQVTIEEDGLTRIRDRYVVSTPLAGRLQRIQLDVGDPVFADRTVLAQMQPTDPSLLDPRAVAQARARVNAAQRRLEAAKTEQRKAESSAELASSEFERLKDLRQREVIPQAEFEAKEIEQRIRSEEVRAASIGVDIAEYELDLQQAALLLTDPGQEPASPGDTEMHLTIKAPIHGRILRIEQESSAVLAAGAPIMEIGDPRDLEVVADVLSADAVRIRPGALVQLLNWGGQLPLAGKVRIVEPSGFTKFSALGVEEQRVNVIIDLLDPPEERESLGDGFRVEAAIVEWEAEDVLTVPTSAMFRVDGRWHVFAVDGDRARQVELTVGRNNGIDAQVLDGLSVGDVVVVHPSDELTDGAFIALRSQL